MSAATDLAGVGRWFAARRTRARCLCGATAGVPVLHDDRYGLPIVPQLCARCGHVYARWQLAQDDLNHFYAESYRAIYGPGQSLKSDQARQARMETARRIMVPAMRRHCGATVPRVLEWGCGAGWNLAALAEAGAEVVGFDLDGRYVAWGREGFGLDLHTIEDEDTALAGLDGPADFIVVNHVLEHVADPMALLAKLGARLAPGGAVFVGLPFIEALPIWGYRDFFHIAHLHYFTIPYFVDLARRHGFTATEIDRGDFFVVLQKAQPAGQPPRHRLYTARLMARHAAVYGLVFPAGDMVKGVTRHLPWLDRALRGVKARLMGRAQ